MSFYRWLNLPEALTIALDVDNYDNDVQIRNCLLVFEIFFDLLLRQTLGLEKRDLRRTDFAGFAIDFGINETRGMLL